MTPIFRSGALCLLLLAGLTPGQAQKKRDRKPAVTAYDQRDSEEYFMDGMKQYVLENYDRALDQFERARKLTPDNAALHYVMAEALVRQGQFDLATQRANRALSLDDTNPYYYLLLAQLQEKGGRTEEALRTYQQLTKRFPDEGAYNFPLADAYLQRGRFDDALKVYDKIQDFYGVNEEVIRQKQRVYLQQNRLDDAIGQGRALIEAFPDEPTYVLGLAEMLVANNKHAEAAALLKKLIASSPDLPQAHLMLAGIYRTEGNEAAAATELNTAFADPAVDIDAKIRVLVGYLPQMGDSTRRQEALGLAALLVEAHPSDPKAYAMRGDLLVQSNQPRAARDSYVRSATFAPGNYTVWEQVVKLDLELQQFDSLVHHTETALELFPNQGVLWFFAGVGHYSLGQYRKTVAALEQSQRLAAEESPMKLDIYRMLGDAHQRMEAYDQSEAAYQAALAIDPDYAPVLNNFSYYLSLRGQKLELARAMGEKLVKAHPNDPTYLDTYGWVLYVSGQYEKARPLLERAAAQAQDGTIVEHYGDVLFRLGEAQEALRQWKRAKAMGGEVTDQLDRKIADQRLHD